jgi:hypothetical protein
MSTMQIVPNPSGLVPVDPRLVVDQPIDDLVAGERIWQGDFIKNNGGTVRRCGMKDATHAAAHGANEGEVVKCVEFNIDSAQPKDRQQ